MNSCLNCGTHLKTDNYTCPHCDKKTACRSARTSAVVFLGLVFAGCTGKDDETGAISGPFAAIEVTPNPVIFGDVGAAAQQTFTIRSVGDANLDVTAVEVDEGADWFRIDVDGVVGTYVPGAHVDVPTTYLSPGVNVTGRVAVLSNDPGSSTVFVDLIGGTSAPPPSP